MLAEDRDHNEGRPTLLLRDLHSLGRRIGRSEVLQILARQRALDRPLAGRWEHDVLFGPVGPSSVLTHRDPPPQILASNDQLALMKSNVEAREVPGCGRKTRLEGDHRTDSTRRVLMCSRLGLKVLCEESRSAPQCRATPRDTLFIQDGKHRVAVRR